jgi:hypothetical protein
MQCNDAITKGVAGHLQLTSCMFQREACHNARCAQRAQNSMPTWKDTIEASQDKKHFEIFSGYLLQDFLNVQDFLGSVAGSTGWYRQVWYQHLYCTKQQMISSMFIAHKPENKQQFTTVNNRQ